MTINNKRNAMFYILVGFVSLVLSIWLVSVLSIKTQENIILQEQIDSLVYVTNILHVNMEVRILDDTLHIEDYLPSKRIDKTTYGEKNIILHTIGLSFISLFLFLYIRCTKFMEINKPPCFSFKKRKKIE